MKNYFIYDGRANHCPTNECCVIECFESSSNKSAIKYAKKHWSDYDYVVCDESDQIIYSSQK